MQRSSMERGVLHAQSETVEVTAEGVSSLEPKESASPKAAARFDECPDAPESEGNVKAVISFGGRRINLGVWGIAGLLIASWFMTRRYRKSMVRADSSSLRNRIRKSESRSSSRARGWSMSRTLSMGMNRPATSSEDPSDRLDETEFEHAFGSELQKQRDQSPRSRLAGPSVRTITYATLTPPPSWSMTSRRLIPHNTVWRLEKELVLTVKGEPTLTEKDRHMHSTNEKARKNLPVSVSNWGLLCKTPVESGALQVYSTQSSSSPHDGTEHTFASAHLAAQFQLDFVSLQLAGSQIWTMYQAFRLIHKGSCAFVGNEVVLHDSACRILDEEDAEIQQTVCTGIPWDDVMRCLGSHSSTMVHRLEDLWWHAFTGPKATSRKINSKTSPGETAPGANSAKQSSAARRDAAASMLAPEYVHNRLLLGPVDFFRLFVPLLPVDAVPEGKTGRARMEYMIQWRKGVGKAALLVQAYTRARCIANVGWQLERPLPDDYLMRRLAFDDNAGNRIRDAQVKNEYYEPNLGRDVVCQVRGRESLEPRRFWSKATRSPTSPYQGYALVGKHVFSLDTAMHLLDCNRDPVATIPSLQQMVRKNPDLDFFVLAVFVRSVAIIDVFARSLPKGIDPSFDNVVRRYINGNAQIRDRKLEVIMQLGVGHDSLSILAQVLFYLVSMILRLTAGSYLFASQIAPMNERAPFPALNLSRCGTTRHFGGKLLGADLPINYVSCTLHLPSGGAKNFFATLLSKYIQANQWKNQTMDFTLVLAGEEEDELPERALGTFRAVRASMEDLALPPSFLSHEIYFENVADDTAGNLSNHRTSQLLKSYLTDPLAAALGSVVRYFHLQPSDSSQMRVRVRTLSHYHGIEEQAEISSDDPVEQAIDDLVDILSDIKIPIRKDQLPGTEEVSSYKNQSASSSSDGFHHSMVEIPILSTMNRDDIGRYFVAAEGDFELTCLRIISSAKWRGRTFPIDINTCRVELHNGQFFQQGQDKTGNPIFYFRDTCLGPWRGDEDAVVASVAHRLESALQHLTKANPHVKYTMIIVLGKPFSGHKGRRNRSKDDVDNDSPARVESGEASTASSRGTHSSVGNDISGHLSTESAASSATNTGTTTTVVTNPRVFQDEMWFKHSNRSVVERLIQMIISHYPERLSKALVVGQRRSVVRSTVKAMLRDPSINSPRIREKIRFCTRFRDLHNYVDQDELPTLVGGTKPIVSCAFDAA